MQLPRGDLILPRQHLSEFFSVLVRVSFFDPIFEGSFGVLSELKMGHTAYRWKAPDVYFPKKIRERRGERKSLERERVPREESLTLRLSKKPS